MNERNCATRIRYTSTMARMRPMPNELKEDRIACTEPRIVTVVFSGKCVWSTIFCTCA